MNKLKSEKGAIMMVIIAIVMLVGLSIATTIQSGIFESARKATNEKENFEENYLNSDEAKIRVNGKEYNNVDEYLNAEY